MRTRSPSPRQDGERPAVRLRRLSRGFFATAGAVVGIGALLLDRRLLRIDTRTGLAASIVLVLVALVFHSLGRIFAAKGREVEAVAEQERAAEARATEGGRDESGPPHPRGPT